MRRSLPGSLAIAALLAAACSGGGASSDLSTVRDVRDAAQTDQTTVRDVRDAAQTDLSTGNDVRDAAQTDQTTVRDVRDAARTDQTTVRDVRDAAPTDRTTGEDVAACAPPDPAPPLGPGGYPMDGWAFARTGLVLDADPGAGALDGYVAPALLVVDDRLVAYATRKDGTTHTLVRLTSDDGDAWSAPAPVAGLEGDFAAYPSVLHEGGRYRLWYTSGSVRLAESDDGLAFTPAPDEALGVGAEGAFDGWGVLYPHVRPDAVGYTMWYAGFDGQRYAIGRARSADGRTFARDPAGPVLAAGAADDFDNAAVAQPCVLPTDEGLLLWYGGYDTARTNPGPFRIGLATSPDGVTWTKRGVTLDLPEDGPDAYSTRDPAVVRFGDGWRMVYAGMGTDYRYRLLGARSATCYRATLRAQASKSR